MSRLFKIAVLGAVAAAVLLTSFEFAAARDRYPYWRNNHHGHYHNGNWGAAAVLGGLAAGVIVGEALSEPRVVVEEEPVYVHPRRVYVEREDEYLGPVDAYDAEADERMNGQANGEEYFPDRPQHRQNRQDSNYAARGGMKPWTAEWRSYCSQRYQSFNARTGTYKGYDGQSHFCTAG